MTRDRVPGLLLAIAGAAAGLEATTFDVNFMTDPVGPRRYRTSRRSFWFSRASTQRRGAAGYPLARPDRCSGSSLERRARSCCTRSRSGFLGSSSLRRLSSQRFRTCMGPHLGAASPPPPLLSAGLWLLFVQILALPLPIGELWIR